MPTTQLSEATAGLTATTAAELASIWAQVQTATQAYDLADAFVALVEQYAAAGSVLAVDWFDSERARLDIPGEFVAHPIEVGYVGIEPALGKAFAPTIQQPEPDMATALARFEGSIQRSIADAVRQTVAEAATEDPQARGWQRVGNGACAFCAMLIGRGAVYTRSTVDFGSHEHCNCSAAPAWGGQPLPVRPYEPTTERISDADRARVRAWIKANQ